MHGGLLQRGEYPGGLHHVLGPGLGPVDVGGVALVEDGDLGPVHDEELAVVLHFA